MDKGFVLAAGDILALATVTLIGFATHGELGLAPVTRILATFVPLVIGWLLVAPWLSLFEPAVAADARQLWRPLYAALLAAPLAAWLRGAALGSDIVPVFVLVLAATSALAVLVWRGAWWAFNRSTGG